MFLVLKSDVLGKEPNKLSWLRSSCLDTAKRCESNSVANPDPGSGAFLTPGSGIRIRDPGWKKPRSSSLMQIRNTELINQQAKIT